MTSSSGGKANAGSTAVGLLSWLRCTTLRRGHRLGTFSLRSFKVVVGRSACIDRSSGRAGCVMLGAECSDSRAEHRATQYHSRVEREVGATMALKAKVREFASSLIVRLVSAGVARYPCPYVTPACSSRALMGLYTELEAGKGA